MTTPPLPPEPGLAVVPRTLHSTWAPSYGDRRPPATERDLAEAADLLRARTIVALTGAGLSTDSGIPDYRGPNSMPRSPMTYQQFAGDPEFRRRYWARNHIGWHRMRATTPNDGHRALAELERAGVVRGVITQNVDRLHQAAGSRAVIDLHGHYDEVICLSCRRIITRTHLDRRLTALNPDFLASLGDLADLETAPDADVELDQTSHFRVAACEVCGGVLKPNIVYFGENVPKERVALAQDMVDGATALVAAGTSLAVQSGLRLVKRAARAGVPVVVLNQGQTRGDEYATLRLNAGTSPALRYLASALGAGSDAALAPGSGPASQPSSAG